MTLKISVQAKVIMAGAVKQNTMPDKYISKRIYVGHHSYLRAGSTINVNVRAVNR